MTHAYQMLRTHSGSTSVNSSALAGHIGTCFESVQLCVACDDLPEML